MEYTSGNIEVRQTEEFAAWFAGLRDRRARARILVRIRRVSLGAFGDMRAVGAGVFEMRVHQGPGYRVYLTRSSRTSVVLLCGGDKRTQPRDIERAERLARSLKE